MRKVLFFTKTLIVLSLLMLMIAPGITAKAQAADQTRLGRTGLHGTFGQPYQRVSRSTTKRRTTKTLISRLCGPAGWPVCLDKVRAWGDKPDADVFLGAGAPAHEVLKKEGMIVPYKPKDWDKIPMDWHGMKVKDADGLWTCFAPWIVTNLYNEKVLKKLRLPPPKTWEDLLDPIYRGNIVTTLPYASGTMHETVGNSASGVRRRKRLDHAPVAGPAQLGRFSTGSTDTTHITARGEVPIGLAQPQMNAMVARRDGYPVRDLLPDKTILVPEAVALLKNAPNEAVGQDIPGLACSAWRGRKPC